MCCVMVKHQCVLYVGWSTYTEIIVKFIIEHIESNIVFVCLL